MPSHTCDWRIVHRDSEEPCGKPANFIIDWGDGVVYWYCSEHYEIRIAEIASAERWDVVERSG